MCVCLHGVCVTDVAATGGQRCECHALYTGAQCGRRSGNALFELPLALVLLLALLLVGLRVAECATAALRFPEDSARDGFAFPRRFERTTRWTRLGVLRAFVGSWVTPDESPARRSCFRSGSAHVLENLLVALVIALEVVLWLQVTAVAFMPVVPWSTDATNTAKVAPLHNVPFAA